MSGTGREALEAWLREHYPEAAPVWLGGRAGSPLEGIQAWPEEAPAHWLLVTYGLSELGVARETGWMSGWGQELTLRVPRDGESRPLEWAADLLHELARKVAETQYPFEANTLHRTRTELGNLVGVVMARDTELGRLDTVNGKVDFLQAVGIAEEEFRVDSFGLVAELGSKDSLLLTRPGRGSRWAPEPPPARPERQLGESNVTWAWRRIEWWLGWRAPHLLKRLAPGATPEQLAAAERELGVSLPEDVRESYLRHNGARRLPDIFDGWAPCRCGRC